MQNVIKLLPHVSLDKQFYAVTSLNKYR